MCGDFNQTQSANAFLYYFFFTLVSSEKSEVLERSTLGHQPVVLGGLFTEVEDEFLPGLALWSTANIELHTSTIKHPSQKTTWTRKNSS